MRIDLGGLRLRKERRSRSYLELPIYPLSSRECSSCSRVDGVSQHQPRSALPPSRDVIHEPLYCDLLPGDA